MPVLTNHQKNRYARHLLLPGFGEEAQLRLAESKVLLIGAGGLGSPVALYLAAAGVGHLTIIDADQVELSNLQRQILHAEEEVGEPKVESAARRLKALNSETQVTCLNSSFSVENALELVSSHDLVIDGSDNFPTRFLANDSCHLAGKPLVYGSIFQYEGQLTLFHTAAGSPCYRCLVPEIPEDGAVPNCLEAGVIGTLPGIIGSLQAMETIKYLAGIGSPPLGKMLYYNGLETSFRTLTLQKDPHCPLCSDQPKITELHLSESEGCAIDRDIVSISASELKELMEKDSSLFLIDVREAEEFAQERIPRSQLIPLSQLDSKAHLIPTDQPIYVHCQSGKRSLLAIKQLSSLGYQDTVNVEDGLNGWKML